MPLKSKLIADERRSTQMRKTGLPIACAFTKGGERARDGQTQPLAGIISVRLWLPLHRSGLYAQIIPAPGMAGDHGNE